MKDADSNLSKIQTIQTKIMSLSLKCEFQPEIECVYSFKVADSELNKILTHKTKKMVIILKL